MQNDQVARTLPELQTGVDEQLTRTPKKLPKLKLDPSVKEIDGFLTNHISLEGYDPHPALRAPISV